MDSEQFIALLVEVVFLLIYGLCLGAQIAFFSLKDEDLERIDRADDRRSLLLRDLLRSPRHTSLSFLIAVRLALMGCVISGMWAWFAVAGQANLVATLVIIPTMTIFVGAIVSRVTFHQNPLYYAYHLATPLWLLQRGMHPLTAGLKRVREGLLSLFSVPPRPREDTLEQEYLGLMEVGHQEGELETVEHRLISRVFEFGDQPVGKVMTPRLEMFSLPLDMDLQEVAKQVKERGYSRVPVYRLAKDDIVGILYARDLLRLSLPNEHPKPQSLEELLHEGYFVQTHLSIAKLFREFQRRNLHMGICVDEYGGVAGLVTMEDLLEELFGEIYDEYDLEPRKWEPAGEETYFVSGRMDLGELQELLQVEIQQTHCQTVAGLVLELLGRLPKPGESVDLQNLHFVVERVTGAKIQSVIVEKVEGKGE